MMTILVTTVLAAWLALTLLFQLRLGRLAKLESLDRFGLVPRWNFFAPLPGTCDYHLLTRDHFAGGAVGPWQRVDLGPGGRPSGAALWHPDKRTPKAFFDLAGALLRHAGHVEDAAATLPLSVPYLMLLNAVSGRPAAPLAVGRQFLLMKTEGPDADPEVLFASNVHEF